ncbi:MAG: DUF4038 domain-containing protein [Kiritimatiellae bacterium]|nr:DUF4038 domain-containing protein [Kiritimatiellia bacterium]
MKTVHQNQTAEWSFASAKPRKDPFNELEVSVRFKHEGGEELVVPAFWAGDRVWRVRFASPRVGVWHLQTICSDPGDAGLHEREGEVRVKRYTGTNPLYRHGPVQVGADRRHFAHADGKPFFWLGDTWWMGLTKRLTWPNGFRTLVSDRVAKGFTVIQIVAGLYPDMPWMDRRGANEAGFPWDRKFRRINPGYFDKADRRIRYLVEQGLTPCIVGCWGYFLPWTGMEAMRKHWRNLVARYGSYPVVWCLAGEVTMPYYLSAHKQADRDFQKKGWNEMAGYLRQSDPYRRPITAHPGGSGRAELGSEELTDIERTTSMLTDIATGWRFRTDPDNRGEELGWPQAAGDDAWQPIRIDAPWNEQGHSYYGAAWYEAECVVPDGVKRKAHLFFRAVDGTARVWIDGQFAGEQNKPAELMWDKPWSLDVTGLVASKRTVRITVKVVKDCHACGIYQPVELREEPEAGVPNPVCKAPADVLDFDMLQTGHGDRASFPSTVKWVSRSRQMTPPMPVVEGEVCYEGIGAHCGPAVQRWLFWACLLNGAAGFTYGGNGIWQVNTRRQPYGPSPHGMSWGNTPWEDAHRLPGSEHLGLAKRFLARLPWWQIEPHPEWVDPGWTEDLCDLPYTCGRHDVPLAAGIPRRLRLIYQPMGTGIRLVKGIEQGVRYKFRLFNPIDGTIVKGGEVVPDEHGDWVPQCPGTPSWHPMPVYQDWVLVLEKTLSAERSTRNERI